MGDPVRSSSRSGAATTRLTGTAPWIRKAGLSVTPITTSQGSTGLAILCIASKWPSAVHSRSQGGLNVKKLTGLLRSMQQGGSRCQTTSSLLGSTEEPAISYVTLTKHGHVA